jgi:NADH:ubiquinone oxidoreductase subunit H
LLQPLADGGKLAFKYKITPKLAEDMIFNLAPVVILFTSLLSWFLIIQGHITAKNNYLLSNPLMDLVQIDFDLRNKPNFI